MRHEEFLKIKPKLKEILPVVEYSVIENITDVLEFLQAKKDFGFMDLSAEEAIEFFEDRAKKEKESEPPLVNAEIFKSKVPDFVIELSKDIEMEMKNTVNNS